VSQHHDYSSLPKIRNLTVRCGDFATPGTPRTYTQLINRLSTYQQVIHISTGYPHINRLLTAYQQLVHKLLTACPQDIPRLSTVCEYLYPQLIHSSQEAVQGTNLSLAPRGISVEPALPLAVFRPLIVGSRLVRSVKSVSRRWFNYVVS
jgi:hypothetical protein